MSDRLSLAKEAAVAVALSKGLANPQVNVELVLDYSGSMDDMYNSGFCQKVLEALVPLAMAFTPNKSMPLYLFSTNCYRVLPDVTEQNVSGYINRCIAGRYSYGSTVYSNPIRMILNKVMKGNTEESKQEGTLEKIGNGIKNFFGGGKKENTIPVTKAEIPTLVIFITDGNCDADDVGKTRAAIIEAAKHAIFWQFWGLSHRSSQPFLFLQELDTLQGRYIDNANLQTSSEEDFSKYTPEQLYNKILVEFPGWYKEAMSKGLFAEPAKKEVVTP